MVLSFVTDNKESASFWKPMVRKWNPQVQQSQGNDGPAVRSLQKIKGPNVGFWTNMRKLKPQAPLHVLLPTHPSGWWGLQLRFFEVSSYLIFFVNFSLRVKPQTLIHGQIAIPFLGLETLLPLPVFTSSLFHEFLLATQPARWTPLGPYFSKPRFSSPRQYGWLAKLLTQRYKRRIYLTWLK